LGDLHQAAVIMDAFQEAPAPVWFVDAAGSFEEEPPRLGDTPLPLRLLTVVAERQGVHASNQRLSFLDPAEPREDVHRLLRVLEPQGRLLLFELYSRQDRESIRAQVRAGAAHLDRLLHRRRRLLDRSAHGVDEGQVEPGKRLTPPDVLLSALLERTLLHRE